MAAPSINGFGGGSSLTPGASPVAWTQNIGTPGSNARLYFGINQADASDSVTAVTWNGSAMTRLATARPAEVPECDIWYIDTPISGSHDFSISFSGDGTYGGIVWWVLVDGAGTHGTPFTVTGTGTSVDSGSQTCPTNGMVLVFALHTFSSSAPTSTAGTDIGLSMPVNRRPVAGYRLSTGNVSWTFGSSQAWGLVGVTIAEVGGGGATVSLSGQSSTVSAGTISPQVDATRALTGEALTTAAGTLTATQAAVQALSGEAATTAAGTLAPSTTVALAGSEATTAAGTISASGDVSQSLSGEESTVSAGAVGVTVSASRALTGQELTTAQGTIAATQAAVVDLTGEAVTSTAGTVGVTSSSSQALTGEVVTTTAGTVGVSTSASVALTGEASTTAIGTVTPSTGATESLSGSALTTAAGTLGVTSSSAVTLAGEQIVVSSGTIAAATPDVTLALSGLTISALLSSIYLEGVWVPVEDENSNLWTAVNDSNANAWTVI